MARTRFALTLFFRIILYFRTSRRLHAKLCQRLFEINEDMVQILLMLAELFTQDARVEDLFCALFGSEPSLFFSNYLPPLGVKAYSKSFPA